MEIKPHHPLQVEYQLTVNGVDISSKVNTRLIDLTFTDNDSGEADSLSITLADNDGALEIPPHKATIKLAIGKKGEDLVDKGTFTVDETGHDGPPDQVTIVARSADFRPDFLPGKHSRSWKKVTLKDVIEQIAAEHKLEPVISDTLAGIRRASLHQTAESDTNFLLRLADQCDAHTNVKAGRLYFIRKGGVSKQGNSLPAVTINRAETESHNYRFADKDGYTGVRAKWNNTSGAKLQYVLAGEAGNPTELPETYATEAQAKAAAWSELARIQRGQSTLSLSLSTGRLDIIAGQPLVPEGFKKQIDEQKWVLVRAVHSVNESGGLLTRVESEVSFDSTLPTDEFSD